MELLLVEDDPQVREFVVKGLQEAGHTVNCADNGKDGLHLATTENYDLLVLDRMLPELDGLTLLKTLRGSGNHVPVLIMSALGDVDERVTGLRAGGDDYLTKPFAFAELLARVEVLGRRASQLQSPDQPTRLVAGDLSLDLLSRKAVIGGQAIELQAREFKLLEYLLRHKGSVVTRTMLLEAVWDYHFDPQTNVIDVHVSRLRKKLGAGGDLIRTVRGAGYILEDQA